MERARGSETQKANDSNTKTAINQLKELKNIATPQQIRTIKGQILAGDIQGAYRGMEKLKDNLIQIKGVLR